MEQRKRTKKREKQPKKIIVLIYIAVMLILFTWIYVLPNVSEAFKKTDLVEYGGIQIKDEITCYIVRSETVYKANSSGVIQYFAAEGDQLRKGSKILDISSEASGYFAEQIGMLSYYIDGQESLLKPETMSGLKQQEMSTLKFEVKDTTREKAELGEPLFKIINSDNWYAVTWIDKASIIKYEKGKVISLALGEESIEGQIEDIIKRDEAFMVILRFKHYSADMAKLRKIKTQIVTEDYKGLIIANESIKTIDERTGVYVRDINGNFVFKPVKVIISDGIYSLVESAYYYENIGGESEKIETVDIYDEILRNGQPNS